MREINEKFTELPNSWEERGIRKGIEQGIEQGKIEVALEMVKEGISVDFIARVTHLDIELIKSLNATK